MFEPRSDGALLTALTQAQTVQLDGQHGAGVYFLIREGAVVYVGRAVCILSRVTGHIMEREGRASRFGRKSFDAYAWISCPEDQLVEAERYWIERLLPEYNNCTMSRSLKKRVASQVRRRSWHHGYSDAIEVDPKQIGELPSRDGIAKVVLNTREASERIGLAESTLEKMRVKGDGPPFVKLARSVRYRVSDLDLWVSQRCALSTSARVIQSDVAKG